MLHRFFLARSFAYNIIQRQRALTEANVRRLIAGSTWRERKKAHQNINYDLKCCTICCDYQERSISEQIKRFINESSRYFFHFLKIQTITRFSVAWFNCMFHKRLNSKIGWNQQSTTNNNILNCRLLTFLTKKGNQFKWFLSEKLCRAQKIDRAE